MSVRANMAGLHCTRLGALLLSRNRRKRLQQSSRQLTNSFVPGTSPNLTVNKCESTANVVLFSADC